MTTTPEQLEALADEVEKSANEDRELDFMIGYAVLPKEPWHVECPKYTASLDAAMKLVPEGFKWKLGYSRHVPCVAEIVDYRVQMAPNLGAFVSECDGTPSLALTAAALRARAQLAREK